MYRFPLGGPWFLCDTFPPFLHHWPGCGCAFTPGAPWALPSGSSAWLCPDPGPHFLSAPSDPQPLFLYISLLPGEPPSLLPSSACPHSTALREHTIDSCVFLFCVSSQSPHGQVQFCPQRHIRKCLETFLVDTTWGERRCYWHLLGGDQKSCQTACNPQDSPPQRAIQSKMFTVLRLRSPALG